MRKKVAEENPDYEMRSLLMIKAKLAPRSASEGNEPALGRSAGNGGRRRQRRLRRIVIPVFQQESDEGELFVNLEH